MYSKWKLLQELSIWDTKLRKFQSPLLIEYMESQKLELEKSLVICKEQLNYF